MVYGTPTNEEMPPLGERTPSRPPRRDPPVRRHRPPLVATVATVALVIGFVAGFALARASDGDGGERRAADSSPAEANANVARTTVATVTKSCRESVRSAQRALALLDQGLKDLRDLRVTGLEEAGREMQRVRARLDRQVRKCLQSVEG